MKDENLAGRFGAALRNGGGANGGGANGGGTSLRCNLKGDF